MAENSRIKINIYTGEFEFEGSEDFVRDQLSSLPDTVNAIVSILPNVGVTKYQPQLPAENQAIYEKPDVVSSTTKSGIDLPDSFGEWHNKFPQKLQNTDLVLMTGYFIQKTSEGNSFETSGVTNLLKEQGIKLSNPSVFIKSLQQTKHVIIIGKRGKLNRFRVSPTGESRIKEILQV
ncbi:hypothetical protein ACFLXY_03770 [Chloroflexota bacterium]